ncbi:MAG: alpha/beta hydrolase [Acidobacteriota bacterium]
MELKAFQGEEHLPLRIEGDGRLALLLIHGFPGTPAEMRPLAALGSRRGITIEAPLLPGFGHQIATLPARTRHDWIGAVREALARLRSSHERVLLAGFSMGGALAIEAAAGPTPPDHLLLLSPFWQLGERWHQPLWPLVRLLLREFKPFARVDLDAPQVQRDLRRSLPDADFDDPATREAIRRLAFPISVIDQVRSIGREAWRLAPLINVPVTVIQGTQDSIVPVATTRRLIRRLNSIARYLEIEADHQLIDPSHQSWTDLSSVITDLVEQYSTRSDN